MKRHELKIWPLSFDEVASGEKTFEIRKNDRQFELGDILVLKEWRPGSKSYSGRQIEMRVVYIIQGKFGLPPDICVMSVEPLELDRKEHADGRYLHDGIGSAQPKRNQGAQLLGAPAVESYRLMQANKIRLESRAKLLENLEGACRTWARVHAEWKAKRTTTGAVISMEYGIRQKLEDLDAFDKRNGVPEAPEENPKGPAV